MCATKVWAMQFPNLTKYGLTKRSNRILWIMTRTNKLNNNASWITI
jgi:hypothetical protein